MYNIIETNNLEESSNSDAMDGNGKNYYDDIQFVNNIIETNNIEENSKSDAMESKIENNNDDIKRVNNNNITITNNLEESLRSETTDYNSNMKRCSKCNKAKDIFYIRDKKYIFILVHIKIEKYFKLSRQFVCGTQYRHLRTKKNKSMLLSAFKPFKK